MGPRSGATRFGWCSLYHPDEPASAGAGLAIPLLDRAVAGGPQVEQQLPDDGCGVLDLARLPAVVGGPLGVAAALGVAGEAELEVFLLLEGAEGLVEGLLDGAVLAGQQVQGG